MNLLVEVLDSFNRYCGIMFLSLSSHDHRWYVIDFHMIAFAMHVPFTN
jgi:hypothetical protein